MIRFLFFKSILISDAFRRKRSLCPPVSNRIFVPLMLYEIGESMLCSGISAGIIVGKNRYFHLLFFTNITNKILL